MKLRTWLPILVVLLVAFALPTVAEEAQTETPEAAVCNAQAPAVETTATEDADTAETTTLPTPDFLGVGLCNCKLGNPCNVPCPSPTLMPRCVDDPCVYYSTDLDGVCRCV